VLVVTHALDLQDDVRNTLGTVTSHASRFVRGLRGAGVPVCVLSGEEWRQDRARMARLLQDVVAARTNQVTGTVKPVVNHLPQSLSLR
jgi:hypothetical protein